MTLRAAAMARPWFRWAWPLAFLALCGPLGIVLALNTRPDQVADERVHASKAESLLDGSWIGHREIVETIDGRRPQQGIDGDPALLGLSAPTTPGEPARGVASGPAPACADRRPALPTGNLNELLTRMV